MRRKKYIKFYPIGFSHNGFFSVFPAKIVRFPGGDFLKLGLIL